MTLPQGKRVAESFIRLEQIEAVQAASRVSVDSDIGKGVHGCKGARVCIVGGDGNRSCRICE